MMPAWPLRPHNRRRPGFQGLSRVRAALRIGSAKATWRKSWWVTRWSAAASLPQPGGPVNPINTVMSGTCPPGAGSLSVDLGVEPVVADLPLDQFGPVQAQVTRPVRSLDLDVDALAGALLG